MSKDKTDWLVQEGRLDPETGARTPDPQVAKDDEAAAVADGRLVKDDSGMLVPTDVDPDTPRVDGEAKP